MTDETALPPASMPLWRALHRRLSTGRPVTAVWIGPLEADQREAIADLFGLDRAPGAVRDGAMQQLDDLLRDTVGLSAREVVERIIGPPGDEAACVRSAGSTRCPMTISPRRWLIAPC
jgi:hypothetical protein